MMKRTLILFSLLFSSTVFAQQRDPAKYVKYLVPIFLSSVSGGLAGANGARWLAPLWLRNDGGTPLDVFPLTPVCCCSVGCTQSVRGYPALAPYETDFDSHEPVISSLPLAKGAPEGAFLYVERAAESQLSWQSYVIDDSSVDKERTQLPLIREDRFLSGRRSVVGVALRPDQRMAVRVYDAVPRDGRPITIRVVAETTNVPIAEGQFAFAYDAGTDTCGGYLSVCPAGIPYHPGYLQIVNLAALFPAIASDAGPLRIEFDPLDPAVRYWPMVTTTDNLSSHVTVYTVR